MLLLLLLLGDVVELVFHTSPLPKAVIDVMVMVEFEPAISRRYGGG